MNASQIIETIKNQGGQLWGVGKKLRYKAPAHVIQPLMDDIKAHKIEIIAELNNAETHEAIQEAIEERAAIQEYDGGLIRNEAEQQAKKVRVFEYRLTDDPSIWLTKITPNYDLQQAERSCRLVFGDRLLEVREYGHD